MRWVQLPLLLPIDTLGSLTPHGRSTRGYSRWSCQCSGPNNYPGMERSIGMVFPFIPKEKTLYVGIGQVDVVEGH